MHHSFFHFADSDITYMHVNDDVYPALYKVIRWVPPLPAAAVKWAHQCFNKQLYNIHQSEMGSFACSVHLLLVPLFNCQSGKHLNTTFPFTSGNVWVHPSSLETCLKAESLQNMLSKQLNQLQMPNVAETGINSGTVSSRRSVSICFSCRYL